MMYVQADEQSQFYQIKKGQMFIQQLMHINLNNPGENFLQLSPMLGARDQRAPSPLLSPDPLFLAPPQPDDMNQFQLQAQPDSLNSDLVGHALGNLSSPLRYHEEVERIDRLQEYSHSNHKPAEPEPVVRRRKEHRSTKLIELKTEELPPIKLPDGDLPSIRKIIQFLVQNSAQPQQELIQKGSSLWGEGEDLSLVLSSLIGKFKKLKKTKQEMTKYCMRKVFKFIADKMKKDRTHNRDVDSCMKLYFSKSQSGNNNFSIPFKKNSIEKTMNGNFLKRVFASQTFVKDYREFLREFQTLMMEDNQKKVFYLAQVLEKYLQSNDLKIQTIKRLPWSRQILSQTEQLAVSLLGYADSESRREQLKDQ